VPETVRWRDMTDPDPHILQQIYVNDNSNDLTGNFASLIVPVVTNTYVSINIHYQPNNGELPNSHDNLTINLHTVSQWRRSVVKYGGRDQSGQAIKQFQVPQKK